MEAPQRFGKYRVEGTLGAGAFATVWLAHDEDLDDAVAIKVLADNWAVNAEVRRRFIDEAKFLRQLDYDGVVRVHTVDELPDGRPYFVMTYADLGTLQDRSRAKVAANTTFSLGEAIGYALDIVECLEVVHDFGIVHRDIKPSNVLFRSLRRHQRSSGLRDDRLMLGDFGLAKDVIGAAGFTLAAGTPAYMAPEQAHASDDLDHRADLFSVAAVLYELVAGRVAFAANRLSGVGESVANAPVPLGTVRDGVPAQLEEIIARGLAFERERRFQSATELATELRAVLAAIPDDDMSIPAERSVIRLAPAVLASGRPEVPTPISMLLALIESVVERFGPMAVTSAAHTRLTNPPRLVVAAATQDHANAASQVFGDHGIEVALMVDANHPESADFLARADVVVVVPAPGAIESVQRALRESFAGPVVITALVVDFEPESNARFAAVAPVDAPQAVVSLARAALVDHGDAVRASGALRELEHELTTDPSPMHAEVWQAIADRVDGMRLAHPELVEFDVLRMDARGGLRLPESMRSELRRLILGSSPVSRLGLGGDAPISAARVATEEALMRWRSYLGSGRAPFAARGVVGTIVRSLERLWIELTDV